VLRKLRLKIRKDNCFGELLWTNGRTGRTVFDLSSLILFIVGKV
jgi:hypothetical protein